MWKIEPNYELPDDENTFTIVADRKEVCHVKGIKRAHLIAAAPDLLAALKAVWDARYSGGDYGYMVHLTQEMCETIPAIIAKARGGA